MLRCHPLARAVAAITLFGLLASAAGQVSAQPAANKKVLTFADYDIWRSASGVTLSRDGQYVAYLVGAEGTDGEAIVRHVASGKEFRFARGATGAFAAAPKFAPDSKRVLLPLTPTKGELEKAKADKVKSEDMPKAGLAVVDLASGTELDRITGVGSFQIAGEGPGFLVYRKAAAGREQRRPKTSPVPEQGQREGR